MSILTQQITFANGMSIDAAQRLRTSNEYKLFDGKIVNQDDPFLFDVKGTGTGTFAPNSYLMTVQTGQYLVRQGKIYCNYSPGRSHITELSWIGFHVEAGVTKEAGYTSSSSVAPYTANLDGVRLYNDGTTIRLQSWNYGTLTSDIPMAQWDNYAAVANYNWANYGIGVIDFLWLGGKGYRFFLVTDQGFVLIHEYHHAGHFASSIFRSPNQPVRYAIRSITGTGSLTYVCSQVSSEGSVSESGKNGSVHSGTTAITLATIGTTYPILGIRKQKSFRDTAVKVEEFSLLVNTNDQILWTINKAPTLSAPLTYAAWQNSVLERGLGNGTITVTNPGRILLAGQSPQDVNPPSGLLIDDLYAFLGMAIDDTQEEIILCGTPITAGVNIFGSLDYKEF